MERSFRRSAEWCWRRWACKQFVQQRSALSATFENWCLTCHDTESYSNPTAIQWRHKQRSVQHHDAKTPRLSQGQLHALAVAVIWESSVIDESHGEPSGGRTFLSDPGSCKALPSAEQNKAATELSGLMPEPVLHGDCWCTRSAVWGRLNWMKGWCKCWYRLHTGGSQFSRDWSVYHRLFIWWLATRSVCTNQRPAALYTVWMLQLPLPEVCTTSNHNARTAQHHKRILASGMPGVIGASYWLHTRVYSVSRWWENGEIYRNRKGYISINVQLICDLNGWSTSTSVLGHFTPKDQILRTKVTQPLRSFAQSLRSWDVIASTARHS